MRLTERCQRLIELLTPVEDLGIVAKTITGCIDGRGHVLDMASPELAEVRRKDGDPAARDFTAIYTRRDRPVAAVLVGRPHALPEVRRLIKTPMEMTA